MELVGTVEGVRMKSLNAWTKYQGPEITLIFELRIMEIHGGLYATRVGHRADCET